MAGKKKKSNAGRPTIFTEAVVKKLEEAFAIDATVGEACFYAGISRQVYYDNVKESTPLYDRFNELRERPVLLARQTAVKKIPESYANAMDYLKRKRKKEFSERTEITGEDGKPLTEASEVIKDLANKFDEFLKNNS